MHGESLTFESEKKECYHSNPTSPNLSFCFAMQECVNMTLQGGKCTVLWTLVMKYIKTSFSWVFLKTSFLFRNKLISHFAQCLPGPYFTKWNNHLNVQLVYASKAGGSTHKSTSRARLPLCSQWGPAQGGSLRSSPPAPPPEPGRKPPRPNAWRQ